ncbi:MAG: EAL domain-containing protein [Pseudanabaenaceae cyanobacterium bins.68]|nr:EAL domain-containing protein [Pseudanabaenaceae cyanobacterium bins.68]
MNSILVIDDEPDNFDVIEALLNDEAYQLQYAASGREAIDGLGVFNPSVILLDIMMPDLNGIEVCRLIKQIPKWKSIPIIVVTALNTKKDLSDCIAAGADDFISKPVNSLELKARLRSMVRVYDQYCQLASFNQQLEATVSLRTKQLEDLIYRDSLTNLPTRAYLSEQIQLLSTKTDCCFGLLYLDCDNFRAINGSFGHAIGDSLLIEIAQRLYSLLSEYDTLVRLNGDEFCFLLTQIAKVEDLQQFATQVLDLFRLPFRVEHYEIYLTTSIGGVLSQDSGHQSAEGILESADIALHQAKLLGKGNYQLFAAQLNADILARLTLENDLQRALVQNQFVVFYQPIVCLGSGKITGFEALIRWSHPERGMVSPAAFIPCLETTGLIVPVGRAVLEQACTQLASWHTQGWGELTVSVNLSAKQFSCSTFIADVEEILLKSGLNPASLKLEITESIIISGYTAVVNVIAQLRDRQIQISLDDFGTGYSSLSYLDQFPLDNLKVDRSFVADLDNPRKLDVTAAIVHLAKKLNLSVTAEGIETQTQAQRLISLGCDYGQGYLYSKPIAASEVEQLLGALP